MELPEGGLVASWLNAWLRGRTSPDDAIDGIAAGSGLGFRVTGEATHLGASALLAWVRRQHVTGVSVALPVPGDLTGLGGPADFNLAAVDAGQALLFHGSGQGAIRTPGGWSITAADAPAYVADVTTADRELRSAVRVAADELARLDVASWSPEIADDLMNLHSPGGLAHDGSFATPAAQALAVQGLRCLAIVELATKDDGGSLSAWEAQARHASLSALARCARTAIAASCSE